MAAHQPHPACTAAAAVRPARRERSGSTAHPPHRRDAGSMAAAPPPAGALDRRRRSQMAPRPPTLHLLPRACPVPRTPGGSDAPRSVPVYTSSSSRWVLCRLPVTRFALPDEPPFSCSSHIHHLLLISITYFSYPSLTSHIHHLLHPR